MYTRVVRGKTTRTGNLYKLYRDSPAGVRPPGLVGSLDGNLPISSETLASMPTALETPVLTGWHPGNLPKGASVSWNLFSLKRSNLATIRSSIKRSTSYKRGNRKLEWKTLWSPSWTLLHSKMFEQLWNSALLSIFSPKPVLVVVMTTCFFEVGAGP